MSVVNQKPKALWQITIKWTYQNSKQIMNQSVLSARKRARKYMAPILSLQINGMQSEVKHKDLYETQLQLKITLTI